MEGNKEDGMPAPWVAYNLMTNIFKNRKIIVSTLKKESIEHNTKFILNELNATKVLTKTFKIFPIHLVF